ncbi:hypothetical protein M3G00_08945 [Brevibacterium casei]|uniref:hypothetical protein n=1 Tax=Brevibacterium casei TaxID=33889 RepID=UPI00223BB0A9|nr:hypothetical protein [Brevibacterium casei]MCT2183060.1 hypothetical protein [Brevibacterium casei]
MNDNIEETDEYNSDLKWVRMDELEVGQFYAISVKSPLTYLLLAKNTGYRGRDEFVATNLVGAAGGRARTATYYRPEQMALIIPPSEVGGRLASAAREFGQRPFRGQDYVQLSSDCWPLNIAADSAEATA